MNFNEEVFNVLGEPRSKVDDGKKSKNDIRSVAVSRNVYNVLLRVKKRFYPDASLKELAEAAIAIAYGSGRIARCEDDDCVEEGDEA